MRFFPSPRLLTGFLFYLLASQLGLAVHFTNTEYSVQPNKAFTLKWIENEGPVTLSVVTSASADVEHVVTIAELAVGSSRSWTPSSSLQSGTYYFKIEDEVAHEISFSAKWTYSATSSSESASESTSGTTSAASGSQVVQSSQQTATGTSSASTGTSFTTSLIQPAKTDNDDQATKTSSSSSDTPSSGLSVGAKAGIGVGAGLGGILLLAAVAFLFYRKGKSRAERQSVTAEQSQHPHASQHEKPPATHESYPELGATNEKPAAEIAGMPIAEVHGGTIHVHPDTRSKFVELP